VKIIHEVHESSVKQIPLNGSYTAECAKITIICAVIMLMVNHHRTQHSTGVCFHGEMQVELTKQVCACCLSGSHCPSLSPRL
jgi:hypothetical protein